MNIAKLNPIGYQAKTEKGNTYKKSNLWATTGLLAAAATDVAVLSNKGGKILNLFSCANLFEVVKGFVKGISPKLKTPINAIGIGIDLAFGLWLGKLLDKSVNKNRMAKADATAQAIDNN